MSGSHAFTGVQSDENAGQALVPIPQNITALTCFASLLSSNSTQPSLKFLPVSFPLFFLLVLMALSEHKQWHSLRL